MNDYSDERLKSWCLHCGSLLATVSTNRDHIPSRSLLVSPLPENVPLVEICSKCNSSFSQDEEYFVSFLSSVLSGTTDPASQIIPNVGRALARNPALLARLEAARLTHGNTEQIMWRPELDRIHRVVLKNARGHAFYEFGEPILDEPDSIQVVPLAAFNQTQLSNFANIQGTGLWPEVGSRMMTRLMTGQDLENGWVIVQNDIYRYAVISGEHLTVRSIIRNYLATEVSWML